MREYKIGIGYDIHRMVEGRRLFLGGVQIPYLKGLLGHSDGDVLLHAICDALLGASGAGDIGEHFPDSDPRYHGIASIELLKAVKDLICRKGYAVHNLDAVVIAQEPRLSPFKKQISHSIAAAMKIAEEAVNIKAKTNEELGELGANAAIAAYAVAMLSREK